MNMMRQSLAWMGIGASLGLSLGLGISAFAGKELNKNTLPVAEIRKFSNALSRVKDTYVDEVEDKKLISTAISGMMSGLDPHSAFLDEDAFRDIKTDTRGEFGGLGIEVQMENGLVKVSSPIEDTPAFRAGILANDLIYQIDGKSIRGMTLNDAVKKMRGKPGTDVKLGILRKDVEKPLEMTLTREIIKVRSVKMKRLDHDIGFIRITNFQENTTQMLVESIEKLYRQGELKGLVLDLRNDPGGLLNAAIDVSSVFLPNDKVVVTTNGRTLESKQSYSSATSKYSRFATRAFPENAIKTVPMVVLINGGSASASEIVAGALQDYGRAKLMGWQSFGKASVQTILPLEDGKTAIKLTTARYYTPKGRSIQVTGVEPDLWIAETKEGHVRATSREADYAGHLANPNNVNAENEVIRTDKKTDSTPSNSPTKPIDFGSNEDFQLQQAKNFILGETVASVDKPKKDSTPSLSDKSNDKE